MDIETYAAGARRAAWCLDLYRVDWLGSYVDANPATRMVCVFEAPDAQAVRQINRRLGLAADQLWAATELAARESCDARHLDASPERDRTLVLVERSFGEPAVFERLQALEDDAAWCLEAHHVRFERTYFSVDR